MIWFFYTVYVMVFSAYKINTSVYKCSVLITYVGGTAPCCCAWACCTCSASLSSWLWLTCCCCCHSNSESPCSTMFCSRMVPAIFTLFSYPSAVWFYRYSHSRLIVDDVCEGRAKTHKYSPMVL